MVLSEICFSLGPFTSFLLFPSLFFFQLLSCLYCFTYFIVYESYLFLIFTEDEICGDAFSFSLKILYSIQELKKSLHLQNCSYWKSLGLCFCCFVFRSCNPYPCTCSIKLCRKIKGMTFIIGIVGVLTKQ